MPEKWIASVGGPEAKTYFVEVKTPRLRKRDVPEPPPPGAEGPLTKTKSLRKPRDIGIPDWLEREK